MTPEQCKQNIMEVCNVSRETIICLEKYAEKLILWNKTINLVSRSTILNMWHRHFLDSAQIFPHIKDSNSTIVDIGSGAGFPGLILAIIAMEKHPMLQFHLIESDSRKCAFMRTIARSIGCFAKIYPLRIESFNNIKADIITARALAPINSLLSYSENILKPNGYCLFLKGENYITECQEAHQFWQFKYREFVSISNNNSRLLKLTRIKRV